MNRFYATVVVVHSPEVAHAAYVEIVYPSGNFQVSEWNYEAGEYTERVIEKDDPALVGFIHRIKI